MDAELVVSRKVRALRQRFEELDAKCISDLNQIIAEAPRKGLERAVIAAMDAAGRAHMQWGNDDCALWCANILQAALGYDGAAAFRGRYRTRIGAARVLGPKGLASALRAAARRHGWRRIEAGQEQPGDIGLIVLNGLPSTMICRAPGWFVGRNERGFTALPVKDMRVIWAVI